MNTPSATKVKKFHDSVSAKKKKNSKLDERIKLEIPKKGNNPVGAAVT